MRSLRRFVPSLVLLALAACASAPRGEHFGEPLERKDTVSYALVSTAPANYYEQTLHVTANVVAVCQKAGCWMQIEDGGRTAMVRWETGCGGKYVFPAEAVGKQVMIQGSFYPKTISPEDAEHLQEEAAEGVVIPTETWEFNASAVVVLD